MEWQQDLRFAQTALGRILVALPAVAFLTLSIPSQANAQAFSADRSDPTVAAEAVTFAKDIAPILQENCQLCHQPASIAPMSFMSYEEVRPWAPLIKQQVVARNMPPFHYDPGVGIQELKDDRRLTEAEIETIVQWVDAGAPLGDVADMPPPVEWPKADQWKLSAQFGEPDVIIPSDPYTVPAEGADRWWRPVNETGITQDRCIRAIEVKPSVAGRQVAHHAIPTLVRQRDAETGEMTRGGTLTEYALGKLGEIIPEGACRLAPANSSVSWEIHYAPRGERIENDVVEVALWFYPEGHEPKYRQDLRNYSLERQGGGPVLDIAPHSRAMTQGFFSWDHPVRLDSFMPHGHYRLKAKWLEIYHPSTNKRELVSMVSNFHPGWQNSYAYQDHVAPLVPAGSVVILTAIHDNTADNPHNPDPDQWVMRGARTTDEMSHAWLAVTHLDDEGYEQLVAEREAMEEAEGSLANSDDD